MKPVPDQLLMPFLGAVEGASLEAQVARMQRQIEGLNADQLRRLYREQKRGGVGAHVSRVIEDALITAMRASPADGEDMPNECGVITRTEPDWKIGVVALQMRVYTGRTRWGYVAAIHFDWRGGSSGTAPLRITADTYRSRALAAAAEIEAFAARLREGADRMSDEHLLDLAVAIGILTERAFMLRMGVWPRSASTARARRAVKRPADAAAPAREAVARAGAVKAAGKAAAKPKRTRTATAKKSAASAAAPAS